MSCTLVGAGCGLIWHTSECCLPLLLQQKALQSYEMLLTVHTAPESRSWRVLRRSRRTLTMGVMNSRRKPGTCRREG